MTVKWIMVNNSLNFYEVMHHWQSYELNEVYNSFGSIFVKFCIASKCMAVKWIEVKLSTVSKGTHCTANEKKFTILRNQFFWSYALFLNVWQSNYLKLRFLRSFWWSNALFPNVWQSNRLMLTNLWIFVKTVKWKEVDNSLSSIFVKLFNVSKCMTGIEWFLNF